MRKDQSNGTPIVSHLGAIKVWIITRAWYEMELKMEWNGTEISVWNMEDAIEWNGMEDFKNGMEDNLPYFHTNSILHFVDCIYRKIHTNVLW